MHYRTLIIGVMNTYIGLFGIVFMSSYPLKFMSVALIVSGISAILLWRLNRANRSKRKEGP